MLSPRCSRVSIRGKCDMLYLFPPSGRPDPHDRERENERERELEHFFFLVLALTESQVLGLGNRRESRGVSGTPLHVDMALANQESRSVRNLLVGRAGLRPSRLHRNSLKTVTHIRSTTTVLPTFHRPEFESGADER